ncbi:MAG: hypothetical protein LBD06_11520 [Candidatus Accumulibacter sp.]|nr:hypothetical protein [Accumulibacter sp.]
MRVKDMIQTRIQRTSEDRGQIFQKTEKPSARSCVPFPALCAASRSVFRILKVLSSR